MIIDRLSRYFSSYLPLSLKEAERAGARLVSCAGNSHDLRPAVSTLIDRIEQVSGSLRRGQPLVVLMSEDHAMPSHIMLQPMLVSALAQREHRVACGMELDHNLLWKIVSEKFKYDHLPG